MSKHALYEFLREREFHLFKNKQGEFRAWVPVYFHEIEEFVEVVGTCAFGDCGEEVHMFPTYLAIEMNEFIKGNGETLLDYRECFSDEYDRELLDEYAKSKSSIAHYDIRVRDEWALITIDERHGAFNCQSSYGTFSHVWTSPGKSFKRFLLGLKKDPEYLLGKVANKNWFCEDETVANWKRAIINARRDREIDAMTASAAWDAVVSADTSTKASFERSVFDSDVIIEISCGEPWDFAETVLAYSPNAKGFIGVIMPAFWDVLTKELEEGA